jgi:hypothetical protein
LLAITIVLLGSASLFWFSGLLFIKDRTIPTESYSGYGLDSSIWTDTNVYGRLFFSARLNESEKDMASSLAYQYDWLEEDHSMISQQSLTEYARTDGGEEFALIPATDTSGTLLPSRYDSELLVYTPLPGVEQPVKRDLSVSNDGIHYAYSFLTEADLNANTIASWSIAVHNRLTGKLVVLPQAKNPTFTPDSQDIVYMKREGIYRDNLDTASTTVVSELYNDMTSNEDYAITSDGNTLVITSLKSGLISIQQRDEVGNTREIGTIIDTSNSYRMPTLSPDGRQYAVVSNNAVEVRFVDNRMPVKTILLERYQANSVQLSAWIE